MSVRIPHTPLADDLGEWMMSLEKSDEPVHDVHVGFVDEHEVNVLVDECACR